MLWHLLSLDAATVAATWTAFIGWVAGVHLPVLDPVAMFVAVWLIYAADRLLDAKPLFTNPSTTDLEERHQFHHRHRRRFLATMLAVCLPLTLLLHRTREAVLHLDTLLACLLAGWLLLVHARPTPSRTSHRLPKELAVGIFFPAAIFIPTVARAPQLRLALLPQALFFAAVCTLNCLFLYAWEHPTRRGHAHPTTRWAVRHLKSLTLTVTLTADALFIAAATLPPGHVPLRLAQLSHPAAGLLASSLSGALLLVLHASRHRFAPTTLRALADVVLLTPAPIAFAIRFSTLHR